MSKPSFYSAPCTVDGARVYDATGDLVATVAIRRSKLDEQKATALIAAAPDLLDSTNALLFVVRALASELGIDPETTEFRFAANGAPIVNVTLADVYERSDAAIAAATGTEAHQ